jgi:hypothetical protein
MRKPIAVERVLVDLRRNTLILELDGPVPDPDTERGTIDIGAQGRLIGVELTGEYLSISDPVPGSELLGRSVEVEIGIDPELRRLTIPRHGPNWELSFPSGNQCWNRRDGVGGSSPLCAVLAES